MNLVCAYQIHSLMQYYAANNYILLEGTAHIYCITLNLNNLQVARETGTLFCAGFGTTNIYDPKDEESWKKTEEMFRVCSCIQ